MREPVPRPEYGTKNDISHMRASSPIKKYLGGKGDFDLPSLGLKTSFFILHHRHASTSFAEPHSVQVNIMNLPRASHPARIITPHSPLRFLYFLTTVTLYWQKELSIKR